MAMARLLLRCGPIVLSRLCAAWLVLMIVLPFSAPFSTCDLTAFLDQGHHNGRSDQHLREAAPVHDAATHALPHARTPHRNPWLTSSTSAPGAAGLRSASRARDRVTSLTPVGPPLLTPLRI
jgi:hypothetical protein